MTPTQLTLRKLRADGYTCEVTEHWNSYAGCRNDLFGIIDVLALRGAETLAVQATSAPNVSARIRKIAEAPTIGAIREAGWTVRVWGWAKVAGRWTLTRDEDVS